MENLCSGGDIQRLRRTPRQWLSPYARDSALIIDI